MVTAQERLPQQSRAQPRTRRLEEQLRRTSKRVLREPERHAQDESHTVVQKTLNHGLPSNLIMIFFPGAPMAPLSSLAWEARLMVHARDVTRLMREGFHWTEANVSKEAGHFILGSRSLDIGDRAMGWNYTRSYSLVDLADEPQWTANLTVSAREIHVLSEFRPNHLPVDMVSWAAGRNGDGFPVYIFKRHDPKVNFNAIYDDMPLDGWCLGQKFAS
ncbi:hypothetical protein B0J13DRAFT_545998 [Dactylonectria estremocensis]|uniref:Uncharacterized protein n=1 Tax=Dactylonectria estremocensis TaxID=1079267 RepID=A0A9P9F8Y7_9HYPO|nr:hypothetical protein B0J13DRAFT_545998 [Dactylonectria estremocensis]